MVIFHCYVSLPEGTNLPFSNSASHFFSRQFPVEQWTISGLFAGLFSEGFFIKHEHLSSPSLPPGSVKENLLIVWVWISTYEHTIIIFSGLFTSILTQLF